MANDDILQQDLAQTAEATGLNPVWLLFREKGESPDTDVVLAKLKEAFGAVETVADTDGARMFALQDHPVTYSEGQKVPSQLLLTDYTSFDISKLDAITRSQFWDMPNAGGVLAECTHQVMISDFMALGLPYKERADLWCTWIEIALGLFPGCAAVFFTGSGKLLPPDALLNTPYQGPLRFFMGGVNARLFNVDGTEDKVVDTLGMFSLGLPDVQYHYHGIDANIMVRHAMNVAIYQFENDVPIENGQTVDMPEELGAGQWKCQYDMSLIQPSRQVLDVEPEGHSAGTREQ